MEVSIVLATYNSEKSKILESIASFVRQKDIKMEILIADDGSTEFPRLEIENFFLKKNFKNYQIIENVKNQGTVKNMIGAVRKCQGNWILSFGPGDCIIGDDCIRRWIDYTENRQVEISFSDILAYSRDENGQPYPVSVKCAPQMPNKIDNDDYEKVMYQYLINGDLICGVALLTKTDIYLKYLEKIENIVIYAEDHLFRLMVLERNRIVYFPKQTILYEYGEGVSTSGKGEWPRLLTNDKCGVDTIIRNNSTKKIKKYYERITNKKYKKWMLYILYPRRFWYLICVKIKPRMSGIIDDSVLQKYI